MPAGIAPRSQPGGAITDRRDLVNGINPAYLRAHAILPIGLDGDRLLCAMARPDDAAAIAGLAFASGRTVIAIAAERSAILATIAGVDAAPLSGVRHGAQVTALRHHLVAAIAAEADGVDIHAARRDARIATLREGRATGSVALTRAEAGGLIAAVDALAAADMRWSRTASFALTTEERGYRIEIAGTGPLRRLAIVAAEA